MMHDGEWTAALSRHPVVHVVTEPLPRRTETQEEEKTRIIREERIVEQVKQSLRDRLPKHAVVSVGADELLARGPFSADVTRMLKMGRHEATVCVVHTRGLTNRHHVHDLSMNADVVVLTSSFLRDFEWYYQAAKVYGGLRFLQEHARHHAVNHKICVVLMRQSGQYSPALFYWDNRFL